MADITLAEFNGRVWLVGGEPFIDDLLANTLASDVSIELIPCENKSDVYDLWVQLCGQPQFIGDPWIIHPAIVDRIRRGTEAYSIFFAEWSAAIDKDAHTVIASVAAWARNNPDASFDLVQFLAPEAGKSIGDLQRLRAQLIEDELVAAGVAPERIGRDIRPPSDVAGQVQESQRIDINVKPAPG
jgi:hypothetical protein